jgi:hypothetical protein
MKRILGVALSFMMFSVALVAARNSHTFHLSTDVRAGNVQLPHGTCEVTWKATSGPQVQLTIETEDRKTVTVPARMVEGKQDGAGMTTNVVNGVTWLFELHTRGAKFTFDSGTEASK